LLDHLVGAREQRRRNRAAGDQHEEDQLEGQEATSSGSIILPIDIRLEATTRSIIRNGSNRRKPIRRVFPTTRGALFFGHITWRSL
jgi:hypothetical protein